MLRKEKSTPSEKDIKIREDYQEKTNAMGGDHSTDVGCQVTMIKRFFKNVLSPILNAIEEEGLKNYA